MSVAYEENFPQKPIDNPENYDNEDLLNFKKFTNTKVKVFYKDILKGTGFMISKDMFITCEHVIRGEEDLTKYKIELSNGRDEDTYHIKEFSSYELYDKNDSLDYIIVVLNEKAGEKYGFCSFQINII